MQKSVSVACPIFILNDYTILKGDTLFYLVVSCFSVSYCSKYALFLQMFQSEIQKTITIHNFLGEIMLQLDHVQAVAFDLDGTLVDSISDLASSANAMRLALKLPELPHKVVQSFVGDGIGVLVHRALTECLDGVAEENVWEQGMNIFITHYSEHIADATRPYPETETGLGLLKTLGIPLAVITNKSELLAAKLLRALNLDAYFSLIIGGDTLPERKPTPLPLCHAADVLGVDVHKMLMVGDSRNDILAAKAAGCVSVGVTFGYGDMAELSRSEATRADWLIDSLPEIYEHLRPQKNQAAL